VAVLGGLGGLALAAGLVPWMIGEPAWDLRRPTHVRRTGVFSESRVTESSGVTASRRQPGILWTLNDSGDDAWIFAVDTLGRPHGTFQVAGARNEDWEAIALGECRGRDCLYIADTGDNGRTRATVTIYRVPEPSLPDVPGRTGRAEALEVRYPQGRRDVEALFVDPAGTMYLVSKSPLRAPVLYRLAPESWTARSPVTAEEVQVLPIQHGQIGNQVTDAALSPSGTTVAVRTYLAIYLFELSSDPPLRATGIACDAAGLQLQGEGVTWLNDRDLALTSEGGLGSNGTIVLLGCGGNPGLR
jgi:hypothetical protein